MTRYTIVKEDNAVYVDAVAKPIDCSGLDGRIRAVQFNTATGRGHIEYENGDDYETCFSNTPIDGEDFELMFGSYIQAWNAYAEPAPSTTTASSGGISVIE